MKGGDKRKGGEQMRDRKGEKKTGDERAEKKERKDQE